MPKTNRNRKQFSQKKAKVKALREVKSNPFEIRLNRQKHPMMGKKRKHEKGNPGIARSKAVEKRKNTLLHEYKQRHKSNKFLDKRIGENDSMMTVEERMMERFAFEKQKVHEKSAIYNLAEEEEELTHFGQSLAEIEKFEDELSDVEDEDITKEDKPTEDNFGGFLSKKPTDEDDSSEQPKSREDVLLDIIANSKKEKYERQKEREDLQDKTEELDKSYMNMLHLLAGLKSKKGSKDSQKSDDYDITVRELMFEAKGKATDRLRSPEVQAREERERLQKLEADRKRRMLGVTAEDERKKAKHRSADELNDFYAIEPVTKTMLSYKDGKPTNPLFLPDVSALPDDEENTGEMGGEGEEEETLGEDFDDVESDEEGAASEGEGSESDDGEDLDSEEEDDSGENEVVAIEDVDTTGVAAKRGKKRKMKESAKRELPFTFSVPSTYQEMTALLQHRPTTEQITVIERVRSCNHPSLADGNKAKLENFLSLLVQYFCSVADNEPLQMGLIHGLTKHIYELSKTSHIPTGNCFRDILLEKYQSFKEVMDRRGHGMYPPISVLLYFKLLSLVFPTSDFKHCIITPTSLFMGEVLSQCQVRSHLDIAKGLFLCNTFLQYVHLSKRIVPEVINFLHGILFLSKPAKDPSKLEQVFPPFKPIGKHINYLVLTGDRSTAAAHSPLGIEEIFRSGSDTSHLDNDDFRLWATSVTLHLLHEFLKLYQDHDSSPEMFAPIMAALEWVDTERYPQSTRTLHQALSSDIEALQGKTRKALERTRRRPTALRMFEPKFEEDYDPTRRHKSTGDKKQNEVKKLVHKHRQEMKGAMRELRKDTQFLASEKIKEQMERDAERKEKVRRLYGMLANQEGEVKNLMRKAGKVKF